MRKNMPKLGAVMMAALLVAWVPATLAKKADAPVARTGQTECFDSVGNGIPCASTGQDGDVQAGVEWPTPRFTDRHDGTVEDNLTGLIWLKNATCTTISPADWVTALSSANALAHGQCGLADKSKPGDWRLPNVKELHSLLDFAWFGPALSNAAGTAQWSDEDAFTGVAGTEYWSSTTYTNPDSA
jgi:Protein of unknown function (DUF1566)